MTPTYNKRVSRYFTLSAYWFGTQLHWALLLLLLIPQDVERFVGAANKGTYLGLLLGVLAVIPLVLPPFLGALSDRLGKRVAFLGAGTAVNLIGLAVMLFAPGFWVYAAGYVLVQLGNNLASSPYAALIPDLVPPQEQGSASGVLGFMQLLGQIVGFGAAIALGGNRTGQFAVIGLVLALSTLITVATTPEPPARPVARQGGPSWRVYFTPRYTDFRWVFLTRAFTEVGRYAVQPFLLYYLADVIGSFRVGSLDLGTASNALAVLLALISVTAAATAIIGGRLSDRVGKKPILIAAGSVMALSGLDFALANGYPAALVTALAFGLGYGAFVSVDWALGTAVLPDPQTYARDMGVWHVAFVFPQLFEGPLGGLLDAGNRLSKNAGYPILFAIAVVFFALGTIFISRVRGVR